MYVCIMSLGPFEGIINQFTCTVHGANRLSMPRKVSVMSDTAQSMQVEKKIQTCLDMFKTLYIDIIAQPKSVYMLTKASSNEAAVAARFINVYLFAKISIKIQVASDLGMQVWSSVCPMPLAYVVRVCVLWAWRNFNEDPL